MEKNEIETGGAEALRSLAVVRSYHHGNTEKVARVIAAVPGLSGTRRRTPAEAWRRGRGECDDRGRGPAMGKSDATSSGGRNH